MNSNFMWFWYVLNLVEKIPQGDTMNEFSTSIISSDFN